LYQDPDTRSREQTTSIHRVIAKRSSRKPR
jgi:hypothetical protein